MYISRIARVGGCPPFSVFFCTDALYVTVPEKRDLNEANFILRYKPFKNVCHIETNVNFKLHWTITFDKTGLCSYFKVHFVEHIKKKKKRNTSQFSYLPH